MNERVSIVIPVFNEIDNIDRLLEETRDVLERCNVNYEIVVVDDHSEDDTHRKLVSLQDRFATLRVLRLSRNFGHQSALLAGLHTARGDAVITMDADLQHPPAIIEKLIDKWRDGIEVVHTIRVDKVSPENRLKKWMSATYYKVLAWVSNIPIRSGMADFRLIDRCALDHVLRLEEVSLFLRGLFLWVGFNQAFVPYQPGARHGGRSGYTMRKMFTLGRDGILSFSAAPLYWAFALGLLISLFATAFGVYAVYIRFFHDAVIPGWASLAVLVSLLFGLQFVFLGLIGSYLGAVHTELKRRPPYIVRDELPSKAEPW